MGRRIPAGLRLRDGIWHIEKRIYGKAVFKSCETGNVDEAVNYLAHITEEQRKVTLYGERPTFTFEEAAVKFVNEHHHKRSLNADIGRLRGLLPAIGELPLDQVNMTTLKPWIDYRKSQGKSIGTINHGLTLVRRILKLASGTWTTKEGLTWIAHSPTITLLSNTTKKAAHPLSWTEQEALFKELPPHLHEMALFAVNTGCRDAEICNLEWAWEIAVPQFETSVFLIPNTHVKNGDDRLVVLNNTAKAVVERQRGKHETHVFTFNGAPINRMNNSGWRTARMKAHLPDVRVHDLKHTFGRRLRSAGVSFEDRQDLLGHRSQRITTHYSAAEVSQLIEAANTVAENGIDKPDLLLLTFSRRNHSGKTPARKRIQDARKLLSL